MTYHLYKKGFVGSFLDKKHTFGGNSLKAGDTFTDILKMTMPTFINSLAECGKLTHDAMLIMDNVRETVSKMASSSLPIFFLPMRLSLFYSQTYWKILSCS